MPYTTTYRRGAVVLVPFPFSDLSTTKQRPALVISPDHLNVVRDDVLLAAITSQNSNLALLRRVPDRRPIFKRLWIAKTFNRSPE
jgi:mRNA-degrading endonuclease toxin of MazEF toxin-antitoxin module